MPQQDMSAFVEELEKIGQLLRITEEKRVDELPSIMEASPDKAVLVEKVKDCEFQFLAGAYSTREQYAHALKCDPRDLGKAIAGLNLKRQKPVVVDNAPCKEIILKGDDVDLTKFPLFLYHPYDGHAFIQDTSVVSRDLETGLINWGIYRFMYRSRNETNVDMRNDNHNGRIQAGSTWTRNWTCQSRWLSAAPPWTRWRPCIHSRALTTGIFSAVSTESQPRS